MDAAPRRGILMIAGFGDNASMFDGLAETALAAEFDLFPFDMPGFGAPPLAGDTTIDALAQAVADEARRTGAEIILAHSVASIIASVALAKEHTLRMILSVEGNITADDAYFSGTAAEYDDPAAFRAAFLERLALKAQTSAIFARYHDNVAKADPQALWQLGRDARRFSDTRHPGEVLVAAGKVCYLYDVPNCPESTLAWLHAHAVDMRRLTGASHWPSVDVPDRLAAECIAAIHDLGDRFVASDTQLMRP
ncbi:MAG: alpha/beta hydrolase [Rhodobacteraceae bacterium]|nr:alpha/beta hydrolase [Paracoccaceae bacterium]